MFFDADEHDMLQLSMPSDCVNFESGDDSRNPFAFCNQPVSQAVPHVIKREEPVGPPPGFPCGSCAGCCCQPLRASRGRRLDESVFFVCL